MTDIDQRQPKCYRWLMLLLGTAAVVGLVYLEILYLPLWTTMATAAACYLASPAVDAYIRRGRGGTP